MGELWVTLIMQLWALIFTNPYFFYWALTVKQKNKTKLKKPLRIKETDKHIYCDFAINKMTPALFLNETVSVLTLAHSKYVQDLQMGGKIKAPRSFSKQVLGHKEPPEQL